MPEPIDHAFHQGENLTIYDVDLVHRQGNIIQSGLLTVGLRRHQTVVDFEAVNFFVDRTVLVRQ